MSANLLVIGFLFFFLNFLATPREMWHLSSPTGIEPVAPALEALTIGLPGKGLFLTQCKITLELEFLRTEELFC